MRRFIALAALIPSIALAQNEHVPTVDELLSLKSAGSAQIAPNGSADGFGHAITKPKSQRAVMTHNLVWFNHYIFGDPLPDLRAPVGAASALQAGRNNPR